MQIRLSGCHSILVTTSFVSVTILFNDEILYYYNDAIALYDTISNAFTSLGNYNFQARPIHPNIQNILTLYESMPDLRINVRHPLPNYTTQIGLVNFPALSYKDLLPLHLNLSLSGYLQTLLAYLL